MTELLPTQTFPVATEAAATDTQLAESPADEPPTRARLPGSRLWQSLIVLELLVLAAAPPILWRWLYVQHTYNLNVVEPAAPNGQPALLRAGQLSDAGLEAAIRAHGVRTVINLRWGNEDPHIGGGLLGATRTEKEVCAANGARYVFLPVADVIEQHTVALPSRDGSGNAQRVPWCVAEFLRIMDDPANHPVLIHCRVGKHRTGILTAVWQLEQGVPRDRVIADLKRCGFDLDERTKYWPEKTFVYSYQPRSGPRDLLYPYLDRTVSPDGKVPSSHAPREQRPFSEFEPAGSQRLGGAAR